MKIKKAFTMIELLIVVMLIGLLLYYIKGIFSYKNVERVKFDTCYIHTYSKVSKFMQDALLQQMVYSGDDLKKVDLYTMKFDPVHNKLDFIYSGDSLITKTLNFSGNNIDNENDCWTKTYHTKLSGDKITIKINPGLQADINESPVKLFTGNSTIQAPGNYTGTLYLYYCQGIECKQKYKLKFIPSTYLFSTSYCIKLKNNGECDTWNE